MHAPSTNIMDFAEVVPKRILQIMNEPGLTRENVASHLQVIFSSLASCCDFRILFSISGCLFVLQKFRSGLKKKKKMEKLSQVCSTDTTSCTSTRHYTLCSTTKTAPIRGLSRMPIATYSLPKPEISTPNFINQKHLFLNQNHCDIILQKDPCTTQMLVPLLPANVTPPPDYPTLTADFHVVRFPAFHQRITVPDECTETMTKQFVQTSFPAMVPGSLISPYSCFSGPSYLMPGDVSSEMSPVSDFVSGGNLAGSTPGLMLFLFNTCKILYMVLCTIS